jgi:hypothetical protein
MFAAMLLEGVDEMFSEKAFTASHNNPFISYFPDKRIVVAVQGSMFEVQGWLLLKISSRFDVRGSRLKNLNKRDSS